MCNPTTEYANIYHDAKNNITIVDWSANKNADDVFQAFDTSKNLYPIMLNKGIDY